MSNQLPEHFIGAWERKDLAVNETFLTDAGRAVWVEAGAGFVDVRGPGGFASDTAFAGTTTWLEPHLTWTHEVDRNGADVGGKRAADVGRITFDGDNLIEEGGHIAGRSVSYRERWIRVSSSARPRLVAVTRGGRAVRVGDHAAAIVDGRDNGGGFAARYDRRVNGAWTTEIVVGDPDAALPPPLEPGGALPEGWEWRCP